MRNFFSSLLALLLILFAAPGFSQTTGSYDTTITFMGAPRQLSIYVPTSYNAANKYRLMICLHGLGDTCTNYRNGLISSLGWATNIPNTIFVCPEAANKNADYYSPAGGEAIIPQSIAFAMSLYHIDTTNVILQGFSLGGRAALRYGLDNYAAFKGLLLNTPAVQGVKEALNGHPASYSFNYANASRIPIYITHGANDIAYESSLDSTLEQLVLQDGLVRYFDFPGLNHQIPPIAQILNFLTFFDVPAHAGKDVDAVRFYASPFLSCSSGPATAKLLFRNTGADTITAVNFKYTLGGVTQSATWTGNLLPFQHAIQTVTFTNPVSGNNAISISIDTLNASVPDTVISNNAQAASLHYLANPLTALKEGFENRIFPPTGWTLEAAGDFYTAWDVDNTVAKTGSQSAGTFNTILYFDNAGRGEGLITPSITIPSTKPVLSFDVAYNYHEYTPPYFTATVDFADTLEVLVSTDCGAHYSSLYKKGGADLATFSTPIINPLSIQADFATPADSNWRNERIDLSSLSAGGSATAAVFKFNYISALGGSINLDNVFVGSVTAVPSDKNTQHFQVYPNPVSDNLFVSGAASTSVSIANMLGQVEIATDITSDRQSISMAKLPAGSYIMTIIDQNGERYSTRIVKR